MAIDTVRDVLGAVPGATPTSTFRDPATNRRVGGAANSFHTRGTPDDPRAVDLVPAPGESMDQLEARLRSSGLNTVELLNEGDHIHVAVDGQPREAGAPGQQPGYRVVNVQDLAPEDTPESLAAQGYQFDASTNRWSPRRPRLSTAHMPSVRPRASRWRWIRRRLRSFRPRWSRKVCWTVRVLWLATLRRVSVWRWARLSCQASSAASTPRWI